MPEVLVPADLFQAIGQSQKDSILQSLPHTLRLALARQQTEYSSAQGLDRVEAWLASLLDCGQATKFDQYPPWAMLCSTASEQVPTPFCRWWGTVGHIKIERDGVRLLPIDVLNVSAEDLQAFWDIAGPVLDEHGWRVQWGINAVGQQVTSNTGSMQHALLDSEQALPMEQASPWSVQNVRLTDYLPMRDDCADWRRMWLNLQVELINAPFNIKREEAGLPVLNCLWFWGGGEVWETTRALPKPKSVSNEGVFDAVKMTEGANEALNRLVFWRNLLEPLLPVDEAVSKPGTVYCADFPGWGGDTAVLRLLEDEVVKPMRLAGLSINWVLLGQDGWKLLQSDWKGRLLFWKNQPDWASLLEPVQDTSPSEEELQQAWAAGQASQRAIEDQWKD